MDKPKLATVTHHGHLVVGRYEMDAGQGIALHEHKPISEHITIVGTGAVTVSGNGFDPFTITSGQVYDYTPSEQVHQLVALVDGTVVFNLPKVLA